MDKPTQQLLDLRDLLNDGLVERSLAIRLALLAVLSGEHLLLIGPPGTAKSLVARRLRLAVEKGTYFERLLTRFSVPEELFGPLSIKGLEEDRYERLTNSYLPKASIAFLDEIFKANSAILNSLLTLLNEREFDNGDRREKTPLIAVVGASNEIPDGEELDALYDRFLLRLYVNPVSKEAFPRLLELRGDTEPEIPEEQRLTAEILAQIQEEVQKVQLDEQVQHLLYDQRNWCIAEKIPVSDRRWRKTVKLLQTSALTNGRDVVSVWDCWLLQYCIWSKAEEREKIYEWYANRVGAAVNKSSHLLNIVTAWENKLSIDKEENSQMRNEHGQLLYLNPEGKETTVDRELRYRAPGDDVYDSKEQKVEPTNKGKGYSKKELKSFHRYHRRIDWESWVRDDKNKMRVDLPPALGPTRHKNAYINHCIGQLKGLIHELEESKEIVDQQISSYEESIKNHLWVDNNFSEAASKGLSNNRKEVFNLLGRMDKLLQGYNELPREIEYSTDAAKSQKARD